MKYVERPIGPALESKFQSRGHRRLHRRTIVELDVDRPGSRQPRLEVRLEERDLGATRQHVAVEACRKLGRRVSADPSRDIVSGLMSNIDDVAVMTRQATAARQKRANMFPPGLFGDYSGAPRPPVEALCDVSA